MDIGQLSAGDGIWPGDGRRWIVVEAEDGHLLARPSDEDGGGVPVPLSMLYSVDYPTSAMLAQQRSPGRWRAQCSAFGGEAVLKADTRVIVEMRPNHSGAGPDRTALMEFAANVRLMALAPHFRQALVDAQRILAGAGPDAMADAMAIIDGALVY